jgi:hypothetical protein
VRVRETIFVLSVAKPLLSKAWVCGRSVVGIAGSNPAADAEVSLLRVLCVCQIEVSELG